VANLPPSIAAGGVEGPLVAPFAEACPDSQWVGYIIEGEAACPEPRNCRNNPEEDGGRCAPYREGEWALSPMVPPGSPHANSAMRRYCLYTWRPGFIAPDAPLPLDRLPDTPRVRLERDCEVSAVASDEFQMPGDLALLLRDAHDAQLEMVPQAFADPVLDPVRIAVVDTSADAQGSGTDELPDISDNGHGDAVGTLAYRTSCLGGDGGRCVSAIRSELALGRRGPRDPQDPNAIDWLPDLGGDFGSQGETARAIYTAVRRHLDEQSERNLIINLSLGWDGDYGDHRKRRLRVPARAALDAAQYATCQGALLIAAAGNRDAFSHRDGPISPAIFEKRRDRCVDDPNAYAPVVHAVQGVDGRDRLIFNARRRAVPRLLAPASFVLTPTSPPIQADSPIWARTHTGSSMAAAAVSGVAALVWSVRPELLAHEVMDIVYASGEPLGRNAKFGMRGQKQPRVRVSACHAFALACAGAAGCGLTPDQLATCGERRGRRVDASPNWKAFADGMLDYWGDPPLQAATPYTPPPAPPVGVTYEPWGTPQPGPDNCPLCGILGTTLVGAIVPPKGLSGFGFGKIHVDLKNTQGCGDFSMDAPPSMMSNDPFKVSLPVPQGCVLKGAGIELYTQSGKLYVTASEMYVANSL